MTETKKLIKLSEFREVAREMAAHEQEEYNVREMERRVLVEAGRRAARADYLRQWCEREGVEYRPSAEGYLLIDEFMIEARLVYGDIYARVLGPCPYCERMVDSFNSNLWSRDVAGLSRVMENWNPNPADHECDSPDRPVRIVTRETEATPYENLADSIMEVLIHRYPERFA